MGLYYNGKKVRNLYYNGKCITRLALGKEMTRLVEGDDFVRAQWLVGDGTAYIDTLRPNGINDVIRFKANVKDLVGVKGVFGNHIITNNRQSCFFVTYNEDSFATRIFQQNSEIYPSRTDDIEVQINQDKVIVNETDYSIERSGSISNYSMPIFTRRRVTSEGDNIVKEIAKLSLNYFAIDGVMYLTPCRLLRPIPATLDANGIARNADECGMYDAVSGKFFGNVAASGVFTVEPSLVEGDDFVRAQWLVGDDIAYIQGVTYDVWNNKIQLKTGKWDGETRTILRYSKGENFLYLHKNTDGSGTFLMFIFREDTSNYAHIGDIRPFSAVPDNLEVEFFIQNAEFYCKQNGVVIPSSNPQTAVEGSWTSINPKIYSAKMSYIREVLPNGTYRSNLTPCRLLRPIPASLDGNGIARSAGDCGMYDSVSGKFYGNVASSGTFTVLDN